ncbi:MAG: Maf-like protein [Rhodospirillaceae bacterium]|nr:Maf-like protein [Rhodospirillaceae bacterium]
MAGDRRHAPLDRGDRRLHHADVGTPSHRRAARRRGGGGLRAVATQRQVVLASTSRTRLRLLQAAGVPFVVEAPGLDEAELKRSLRAAGAQPAQAAETLAEMKAQRVSRRRPGEIIIGADQLLACEGVWFDKPASRSEAAAQLRALRGRRHDLVSSVAAVRDGVRLWHATDAAQLTVRPFSDAFLEDYLERAGVTALESVGGYQLEALGAQIFSRVRGDFFTILGLPLLPLLDFLRAQGIVAE